MIGGARAASRERSQRINACCVRSLYLWRSSVIGLHHTHIRVIQVLLGHVKIENTALYVQVATDLLHEVTSPLDRLPPE
jgi:hypothetical protein